MTLDSEPPGATVYTKGYNHPEREWIEVGETPIEHVVVAQPARFRVEMEGYVPFEGAPFGAHVPSVCFGRRRSRPGWCRAAASDFGDGPSVEIEDFWIDTFEVTNREYKAFVDAGGYRDERLWRWEVDRSAFVDSTGRPGPAGWALGDYPEGRATCRSAG